MRCLYQAKLRVCDDPSVPSVAEVDISPLHKMKDGIERSGQDEKHAHIGPYAGRRMHMKRASEWRNLISIIIKSGK